MALALSNRVSAVAARARDAAMRAIAPVPLSSLLAHARDAVRGVPMLVPRIVPTVAALVLLVVCMGGRWRTASASPHGSLPSHASGSPATPAAPSPGATHVSASPSGSSPASASARGGVAFDDGAQERPAKKSDKDLGGKLNLNTATEDQLMLLPTVGPAKAERIVTWRKKNGGFRRTADLRRVKGFGYKTFKRLEPFLAVTGDTTLR